MVAFGKALAKIRARVVRDLKSRGITRERVLATIVRLLEITHIRVGNEEYSRQNNSFGLTTFRNRHVKIGRGTVHFYFRGKSGIKHDVDVQDPHLAGIVRRLRDLPGYELFQYIDDDGATRSVSSTDVNSYIREISGEDFTAKDFRTWAGTILAAQVLCETTPTQKKPSSKNLTKAIAQVASELGNTAAVCRKCYIHPAIIDAYLDNSLQQRLQSKPATRHLRPEESAVLCLLGKLRSKPLLSLKESLEKSVKALKHKKVAAIH
jgi:DNA topoisomerase-1